MKNEELRMKSLGVAHATFIIGHEVAHELFILNSSLFIIR